MYITEIFVLHFLCFVVFSLNVLESIFLSVESIFYWLYISVKSIS